jgi:SAM-dependent methyltransferase
MITTWSQGPPDDFMPEDILVATLGQVRRHPWFAARAKLVREILRRHSVSPPASVIEVGCGWGVNLQLLEQSGYHVVGLDISRRILELIDQPQRRLIEADLSREAPTSAARHDALLALDVIEHLDDDNQAVCRFASLVRPGGLAVISVPALPELFSDFDRIQVHRRRYVPSSLRAAFANSSFDIREIFWWGRWMVPLLRRMRQRSRNSSRPDSRSYSDYLRPPAWPICILMRCIFAWEQGRALNGRLHTGTSLFAVAMRES